MELVHDDTRDYDESTTSTTVDQCITVGGDDIGSSCVFPFTFNRVVYDKCTTVDDTEGKPWCSTLTDEEGEYLNGNWGYCPSSASCGTLDQCITTGGTDNGTSCVFPFTYHGVVYDKCTTLGHPEGKPWCSTLTDEEGEHLMGNWGYCPFSSSSCGTLDKMLSNCVLHDEAHIGNDLLGYPKYLPSLSDCWTDCQNHPDCQFWSWDLGKKWCSLKYRPIAKPAYLHGFVAGERSCNPIIQVESTTTTTTSTTVDQCITIGGDDILSSCVFPFTYDGVVYDKCTTVDDHEGKPWCSTLTNEEEKHIAGQGNWGYCPISASCGTLGCKCGVPNGRGRIINGVETEANEYPWMVKIFEALTSKNSSRTLCGGILISSRTVLTAAECTEVRSRMYVLVGEHDLDDPTDGQQKIEVERVIDHPDYTGYPEYDYDFSILILKEPVTWRKEVKPICLPQKNGTAYEGVKAIVTGWGATNFTDEGIDYTDVGVDPSRVLMETEVTTMSNENCTTDTRYNTSEITTNMICAFKLGTDSCLEDMGGPLTTVESESPLHYSLIGVVSWGKGCARPDAPGIYARVTAQLQWIKENMEGDTCAAP